ncbi:MAG: hypothetical protein IPM16_10610 [Chloroflexi bacterium]|nr:hypothetical protein [Chloroflexota bacterium]
MRKFLPLSLASALMLLTLIVGAIRVDSIPVLAQDTVGSLPDLSGANIYFSETYQEMSQFDRSDAGISRFAGLLRLAGANLFTLEWRKGIPDDADLIVIANPSTDIAADNVARLWTYLQSGGRVLLLADAFDRAGAITKALPPTTFFQLAWSDLGLQAAPTVIVREDGTAPLELRETNAQGDVTFEFSGEVPVLAIDFYTRRVDVSHPITSGLLPLLGAGAEDATPNLNSLFFMGARPLQIDASIQDFSVTPLVLSDIPNIYAETNYARYATARYSEYNIGSDSQRGDMILAAAYEDGDSSGRMVLIGDGDVIRNGTGFVTAPSYSGAFVYPVNVQFALRSVFWLLDSEQAVIDLPTPGPTATATITPSPTPSPTPTTVPTETPTGG